MALTAGCSSPSTLRQRLRALRVPGRTLPSYAAHAKWCHTNFTYDDARGTDEQMLELSSSPAGRRPAGDFDDSVPSLVRQEATVRVHQLCADSKTAKRKATKWPKEAVAAFAEPPAAAGQKERALQFIYDDEVRCGSRFGNDDAMLRGRRLSTLVLWDLAAVTRPLHAQLGQTAHRTAL